MPTNFQMGIFLPDICWISDGMRQVVLGWKLLKADRKIMPGQQALLPRACPITGRVFSPTPQRKVTGWQVIPMLISEEPGISGLLGTRGDLDRPTCLPRIFWSGTNLSHSPVTTTGPQLKGTRCQGGSRWKRGQFFSLSHSFSSVQWKNTEFLWGCHAVCKKKPFAMEASIFLARKMLG